MEWKTACGLSEIGEAYRVAIDEHEPYRANARHKWVKNRVGNQLPLDEASSRHDWLPLSPFKDPISALGAVSRRSDKPLKQDRGSAFDALLYGMGW